MILKFRKLGNLERNYSELLMVLLGLTERERELLECVLLCGDGKELFGRAYGPLRSSLIKKGVLGEDGELLEKLRLDGDNVEVRFEYGRG